MELIENKSYNWTKDEHRELLRGMLMTVCDLAAITKPWDVERRVRVVYHNNFKYFTWKEFIVSQLFQLHLSSKVAELVASEFFEQGDIEREELNITPIVSPMKALSSKHKTCINKPHFDYAFFNLYVQDMMNREKKDQLPTMQVGFIDSICEPVYEVSAYELLPTQSKFSFV